MSRETKFLIAGLFLAAGIMFLSFSAHNSQSLVTQPPAQTHQPQPITYDVDDNAGDIGIGFDGKPNIGLGSGITINADGEIGIGFKK